MTNTPKPRIQINAASLIAATPQMLMLLRRHGRIEDPSHAPRHATCSHVEEKLRGRELNISTTYELDNLIAIVTLERFYHQSGRLCRLAWVRNRDAAVRRNTYRQEDAVAARFGAWVAGHYYAVAPKGIRIVYHVLSDDRTKESPQETWCVDLPLAPESEMKLLASEKLGAISAAWNRPDNQLPGCIGTEPLSMEGNFTSGCAMNCPVRHVCHQPNRLEM